MSGLHDIVGILERRILVALVLYLTRPLWVVMLRPRLAPIDGNTVFIKLLEASD